MIKITARTEGDNTVVEIQAKGSSDDIGAEAAHIVTELPAMLLDKCEPGFHVMRDKVREIADDFKSETMEVHDGKFN